MRCRSLCACSSFGLYGRAGRSLRSSAWKAFTRDTLRIRGESLEDAQQILADDYIFTGVREGPGGSGASIRKRVTEMELQQLGDGQITFGAFSSNADTSIVWIEDGVVVKTWVWPD
jgi:hypothetical protein